LSKRFYQIAFDLGARPRQLIRELTERGLSVGNQMAVIVPELEARIRDLWEELQRVPAVTAVAEAIEPAARALEPSASWVAEPGVAQAEVHAAAPEAAAAPPEAEEEAIEDGEAPPEPGDAAAASTELVPTLDPRAGRLVKDAPAGGFPGASSRARPRRGEAGTLVPQLPSTDRAPGARRESGRRQGPERDRDDRGKRGKETFTMRKPGAAGRARAQAPKARPTAVAVKLPITVKGFGEQSGVKAAEIIKILFKNHKMLVTANSVLDKETLELLGIELGIEVSFVEKETAEDVLIKAFEEVDDPADLCTRPPIVTILGHVDHGKTTLLDKIRSTDVASREAGGITQHIAASQVTLPDGRRVTFIDTPGHEAFTEMRARGAQVTDIVVLIVAADDGVMPQTIEAISHARAAGVDIVVAITKCDKDNARPERVKQQLSEHGIYVEGYGGDVSVYEVSGITGQGVSELLSHLALMAEVDAEHFTANPKRHATGTVIEAQNSPRRGIVATVLVQNGSLHKGEVIVAGEAWGTARALFSYRGNAIRNAGPSDPVEVIGLDRAPEAGSKFYVAKDVNTAKQIAESRRQRSREEEIAAQSKPATLDSLLGAIEQGKVEEVRVVVKADVDGSLQPLKTVLERMSTGEVKVSIVHAAVGAVNESDIVLAAASRAHVIGFHVNVDAKARAKAKQERVDIRTYRVIYDIEQDVRDLMEGRLAPEMEEVVQGHAEVLQVFTFSKIGNIAGCRVKDGTIKRDALVRVKRGDQVVHEGSIGSLRREKDAAREVREGLECGLTIEGWDAFQAGDLIEAYTIEARRRTLQD
jgi:translation initiation factor IF-2